MRDLKPIVSTHAAGDTLNRLSRFRLKEAERKRDLAILEANLEYHAAVEEILLLDRHITLQQKDLDRANGHWWPWERMRLVKHG